MNTHTPAMDALKNFLDASGGKALGNRQKEMFESLYAAARAEQQEKCEALESLYSSVQVVKARPIPAI